MNELDESVSIACAGMEHFALAERGDLPIVSADGLKLSTLGEFRAQREGAP